MKSSIQIKKIAKEVIKIEQEQIENLVDRIDEDFIQAIKLISSSNGRLIVAGVGKSANISSKLVATFNSTGQPAIFLHAADAVHGDLGNVQEGDVVLCLSKSGNTNEIKSLINEQGHLYPLNKGVRANANYIDVKKELKSQIEYSLQK